MLPRGYPAGVRTCTPARSAWNGPSAGGQSRGRFACRAEPQPGRAWQWQELAPQGPAWQDSPGTWPVRRDSRSGTGPGGEHEWQDVREQAEIAMSTR